MNIYFNYTFHARTSVTYLLFFIFYFQLHILIIIYDCTYMQTAFYFLIYGGREGTTYVLRSASHVMHVMIENIRF